MNGFEDHNDHNGHRDRHDTSGSDEGIDRSFLESLNFTEKFKIFNDSVHSQMELPHLCVLIMNTPEFQRLKNLKQLGLCYYVFPSASNNRFEHCVGTSHLAGKYGKILREKQPELDITDKDILCLYLAGLMHDLGHGPFSHMWEQFMHSTGNKEYSHETMSLRLVDDLKVNLKDHFDAENLHEEDITCIKEMIFGEPLPGNKKFHGRPPRKHFLYQIVSNAVTKIDVDKFDYILRDSKNLNVSTSFAYERLMSNSRVVEFAGNNVIHDPTSSTLDDVPTKIVYRKKIGPTLEDLFKSRFNLHHKVYQHRVTRVIEEMILDGLKAAEPSFKIPGSNGESYFLSTAYKDTRAFIKLTDSIFERILLWKDGGDVAAKLFKRIVHRDLYPFLGYVSRKLEKPILDDLKSRDDKIRFIFTNINYGSKEKNPLDNVVFYEKERPNLAISNPSTQCPHESRTLIVYANPGVERNPHVRGSSGNGGLLSPDLDLQAAKKEVDEWAKRNQINLEYE